MTRPDWIAVDWGTSTLRAYAMGADGGVLATARSGAGMGSLARDGFEPALLDLVGDWLGDTPRPVIACGMVGARQGWVEAPYTAVPCAPDAVQAVAAPVADARLDVTVLGGVKQDRPADVMRGEETQIAGAQALTPGFDGIVCLPGTHTKWAEVSAGEIVSFRTFMTGEIFATLRQHSVLRHTMGDGWDDEAFAEAVSDAMSRPEAVAARLFGLRAEALLHDLAPATATARLSGLLIGMELAAARPYWLGRDVLIVGADASAAPYAAALTAQGLSPRRIDGAAATLAGLARARIRQGETS